MFKFKKMREEKECLEYFKDDPNIKIVLWGEKNNHFKLKIQGSEETPYKEGKFIFEIKLSDKRPFYPPYVYCITLIWHPNIDNNIPVGKSNISGIILFNPAFNQKLNIYTGESGWTPSKTLKDVIIVLKDMIKLKKPWFKPDCALNYKAEQDYGQKNIQEMIS